MYAHAKSMATHHVANRYVSHSAFLGSKTHTTHKVQHETNIVDSNASRTCLQTNLTATVNICTVYRYTLAVHYNNKSLLSNQNDLNVLTACALAEPWSAPPPQ